MVKWYSDQATPMKESLQVDRSASRNEQQTLSSTRSSEIGEEVEMSPSVHPRAPNNSPAASMTEPQQHTQGDFADVSATVRPRPHSDARRLPIIEPQQSTRKKPTDMAEAGTESDGAGWSRVNWKAVITRNTLQPSEQETSILYDDVEDQARRLRIDAAVVGSTKPHEYAVQPSIKYETMNTPVPGLRKTHQNPVEPSTEDEIMDIENVRSPKGKRKLMRRQTVVLDSMKYGEVRSEAAVQRPVLDQYMVEPSMKEQNTVDTSSKYQVMSRKRVASSELPPWPISSKNQVEPSRSQPLIFYENGTFQKRPRVENHEQIAVRKSGHQPSILSKNDTLTTTQQPSMYSQNVPSPTRHHPSVSFENRAFSTRLDSAKYSQKAVGLNYDLSGPATLRAHNVPIQHFAKYYENRPPTTLQQLSYNPLKGHTSSTSRPPVFDISGPAAGYDYTDYFPSQNPGPTPSANAAPRPITDGNVINFSGIMGSEKEITHRILDASTEETVATPQEFRKYKLPSLATTSYDYTVSKPGQRFPEVRQATRPQVSTQDFRQISASNQVTSPQEDTRWETNKSQPPYKVHQHHQEHGISDGNTSPCRSHPEFVRGRKIRPREERAIRRTATRMAKRNAEKTVAALIDDADSALFITPSSSAITTTGENSIQQRQAGLSFEEIDDTSTAIAPQTPSDNPQLVPLTTFAAMGKPNPKLSSNAPSAFKRVPRRARLRSQLTPSVVNQIPPVATAALSGTSTASLPPSYLRYSVKDGVSMVSLPPPKDTNTLSSKSQLAVGKEAKKVERREAKKAELKAMENVHNLATMNHETSNSARISTPFPEPKVPSFETVAGKEFPVLADKIGYATFASNTYDINEGRVTLRQLEDVWEAAIWSAFLKWDKEGTKSADKMTLYYEALHQIYDRSTEFLRRMDRMFPPMKYNDKLEEVRKEQEVDIKMHPGFKQITHQRFTRMVAKLPFQTFAQDIFECNEKQVTLKQLEDAWEKFLWTAFKHMSRTVPSETKVARYITALNQIHTCQQTNLLKELAEKEGRIVRGGECGEIVDMRGAIIEIKVPHIKKILDKGSLKLVVENGYQKFAQSMYHCNEGKVTLEMLEKAWEALLWLEFQKWDANNMPLETKIAWYRDARNQIYHRNTPLLKDLANRAGMQLVEKNREDSSDMEDSFRSLPLEFDTGEGDELIAASPAPKAIRQGRAQYNNSMQTVLFLPGYFEFQARGEGLPFLAAGAQLQYAADYYWDADGEPLADLEIPGTINAEFGQERTGFKVEMERDRTPVDEEDLYDDSGDEGVKTRKAIHGKKVVVIDLTGDDMDIDEVAGDLETEAVAKEDTKLALGTQ